jgi:hypothetical protein
MEDAEIYVGGKLTGRGLTGMIEALPEMLGQAHAKRKLYEGKRVAMTVEDWQKLGWSEEEAEKHVQEGPQNKTEVNVLVRPDNDEGTGYLYELPHHVRHSPDGFEWGYAGSGPAELARCILIDFFDLHEQAEQDEYLRLPVSYQDFKFKFIAGAAKEGFVLDGTEIDTWVREQDGDDLA